MGRQMMKVLRLNPGGDPAIGWRKSDIAPVEAFTSEDRSVPAAVVPHGRANRVGQLGKVGQDGFQRGMGVRTLQGRGGVIPRGRTHDRDLRFLDRDIRRRNARNLRRRGYLLHAEGNEVHLAHHREASEVLYDRDLIPAGRVAGRWASATGVQTVQQRCPFPSNLKIANLLILLIFSMRLMPVVRNEPSRARHFFLGIPQGQPTDFPAVSVSCRL